MMVIARQSTARTVMVGPVLDADGVAVTDGVVGDFKISKNGGAPAALNGSATLTHRNTGHYSLALTTSDLDTVGQAEIVIDDTVNACPVKVITVVEEAVYDILFAASATGAVPVASIANNAITASAIANDAITAAKIATGAIDADAIAADAITAAKVAADVTTEIQSGLATAAELAKVPKSDGTATWNATALASIQGEANDALVANHLDHLLAATYDPASKPGAADALLNELVENDAGVARFTANALEQGPSGSGPSAADIADAVWEEAITDHSGTAGSTAEQLAAAGAAGDPWATALPGAYGSGTAGKIVGDNLNATVSSRLASASYTAPLDAAGTRTAVGLASANLDTQFGDLPTAAENATAVWGAGTRVLTAGTNIALAKGTGVTGFNDLSAAQVNAEVDTALADYDGPTRAEATADKDEILADLATTDGKVDGVKANTDKFANLPVLTAGGTGGQGYGAP